MMKWDTFWELIGATVRTDPIEHASALETALRERKWFEVLAFQSRMDEAARTADAPDVRAAAVLVTGSATAAARREFLVWLVSRGKPVYLRGIENPDSLADLLTGEPVDAFGIANAPLRAYEALTGTSDFYARLDRGPQPPEPDAVVTEDELRAKFPRLFALYAAPDAEDET